MNTESINPISQNLNLGKPAIAAATEAGDETGSTAKANITLPKVLESFSHALGEGREGRPATTSEAQAEAADGIAKTATWEGSSNATEAETTTTSSQTVLAEVGAVVVEFTQDVVEEEVKSQNREALIKPIEELVVDIEPEAPTDAEIEDAWNFA